MKPDKSNFEQSSALSTQKEPVINVHALLFDDNPSQYYFYPLEIVGIFAHPISLL